MISVALKIDVLIENSKPGSAYFLVGLATTFLAATFFLTTFFFFLAPSTFGFLAGNGFVPFTGLP